MLNESKAKQPIDESEDKSHWADVALPLVRKVFKEMNKPNGVIFKRDDGQLIIVLIKDGKWDWDNCLVLKMEQMTDKYDDISAKDPFEFVFIKWDETKFTTMNKKTEVPHYSMLTLAEDGKLQEVIEKDYEAQYGKDSV